MRAEQDLSVECQSTTQYGVDIAGIQIDGRDRVAMTFESPANYYHVKYLTVKDGIPLKRLPLC